MKFIIPILFIISSSTLLQAENHRTTIDQSLNEIAHIDNSKKIVETRAAIIVFEIGEEALHILVDFFTDTSQTNVYSDCKERHLNKGELAIIVADLIEYMPLAKVTHIQNCLMTFCEDNPNLIEYYLDGIKNNGVKEFQERYRKWLVDPERDKNYKTKFRRN